MKKQLIFFLLLSITSSLFAQEFEWAIEPQFSDVYKLENGVYKVYRDGKLGIVKNGNMVIQPIYDEIDILQKSYYRIKLNEKFGVIENGIVIIPPKFEYIDYFSDGLARAKLNGKWGFVDKTGNWVIQPRFKWVNSFSEGLAVCFEKGKYGYIDKSSNWIIKPIFDMAFPFSEGLACCYDNDKYGYINEKGKWIILPQFTNSRMENRPFIEGLSCVGYIHNKKEHEHQKGFIDKSGNWKIEPTRYGYGFDFFTGEYKLGFGPFDRTGKWLKDKSGLQLVFFSGFTNGIAIAAVGENFNYNYGILDENWNWIVDPVCKSITKYEDFYLREFDKHYDVVDKTGKIIVDDASMFERYESGISEGLVSFKRNDKYGYMNLKGEIVISPQFYWARSFDGGYAPAAINGKYGFITSSFVAQKIDNSNPPILSVTDIEFFDNNNNNRIDANEECNISFNLKNSGKGNARNVFLSIINISDVSGLTYKSEYCINLLEPNSIVKVNIPISSSLDLTNGTAKLKISFSDRYGFAPDPIELSIESKAIIKPIIKIVDHAFITEKGNIRLGQNITLKAIIQNTGQGVAEDVHVNFVLPDQNVFPNGPKEFKFEKLNPGDSKELIFEFIANKLYAAKTIPIDIKVFEKFSRFSEDKIVEAEIDAKTIGNSIIITSNPNDSQIQIQLATLTSDVDINIPSNQIENNRTFVLIFANENYNREVKVEYALNDGKVFREYCEKTLGIPAKNIHFSQDATFGIMKSEIKWISDVNAAFNGQAKIIFYYAGHGMPNEVDKSAYLLPVDGFSSDFETAIKLDDLYSKLSSNPSQSVTVFLDACFSGSIRDDAMLANARGVKIKPNPNVLKGNMLVFSAASREETAYPYKEKQHGLFTYFLLKKLQETKGDVNYETLLNYIRDNVRQQSVLVNQKSQTPQINIAFDIQDTWRAMKMK